MDTIKFKCTVDTSNSKTPPLLVSFLHNNEVVYQPTEITKLTEIEFDLSDEEGLEHSIKIIMSGKTEEHTVLDDKTGDIVTDTHLIFNNFSVDEIDIDHILLTKPWPYTHNFNGTGEETVDEFYDIVGCNGTIEFKFTTPFYIWLLENI